MSSTENNNPGARRDEQRTRFLSRENIVKILKTTVVLSALLLLGKVYSKEMNLDFGLLPKTHKLVSR